MTIVGISFGTLVEIAFWGWVAGVATVIIGVALLSQIKNKS